jgi:carbon storage regulator
MLVITRRAGESIIIGENIKITVWPKSGNFVRLGIKAPKDVRVMRSELIEVRLDRPLQVGEQDTQHGPKTLPRVE